VRVIFFSVNRCDERETRLLLNRNTHSRKMVGSDSTLTFLQVYGQTFLRPSRTFQELQKQSIHIQVRYGFLAVLINAFCYTLVYVNLIRGGGRAFKPWLAIDPDIYYTWNVYFCLPSMFIGWILACGIVQTLCFGEGTFENLLGVFGLSIGIASYSTLVHDLFTSFLGAIKIIDQRDYEMKLNTPTIWRNFLLLQFLIYFIWFISLFSIGVRATKKYNWSKSIMLGTIGFFSYQLFFAIFNR
jgi:hypothetical protein